MMIMDIFPHTDLMIEYLSISDLSQLRQTCSVLKQWVEKRLHPDTTYTWIQKCRLCDPQLLWKIDGQLASCYKPVKKQWIITHWQRKLPSIVPHGFWNYFMRIMKSFVSMSNFQQWSSFEQIPLLIPPHSKRWDISMQMVIVGTSVHNQENYPQELKDIDEFISVGVTLREFESIHDSILGLNAYSIGWHSDDGKIYLDSLMLYEGQRFGNGDVIEITIDYTCGVILFKRNNRLIYLYELTGEFLSNPLMFCATCSTMNSLFFSIN